MEGPDDGKGLRIFKELVEGNMAPVLWRRGSMLRVKAGEVCRRTLNFILKAMVCHGEDIWAGGVY